MGAVPRIVTVTLNPAVDRVLRAPGFRVGSHAIAERVALYPAGKGVVVSRVLSRLGVRSIATGFVGRSELGMFEEHFQRTGGSQVVCQLLVVNGQTRENTTIIDPINDIETHLRDIGFEVQPEDVRRIMSKVGLLACEEAFVLVCGSHPPGFSTTDFAELLHRCRAQGARAVVDTSGQALQELRGRRVWMTKLNSSELAEFSGLPTETESQSLRAARSLCVRYGGSVDVVVATRGADGAALITKDTELIGRVGVHPGRVVSTVGCGDALLAGLVSEWSVTGDWAAALRYGLAAATSNAVSRDAGAVLLEDIEEFHAVAMIEPVEPDGR